MALLCSITLLTMVAQQQPKSLQCHYLLEHPLQPQTVTVNNQLRSKRSSHFVALRSKVHKKVMPGHTKCCTCHAKWLQQTWRSDAPKCNPSQDLLKSLMNMSLVLRLPRDMHLCRPSSNVPRLPSFLELPQNPHVLLTFDKVHNPLRLPRETTSQRPKVVRTWCF